MRRPPVSVACKAGCARWLQGVCAVCQRAEQQLLLPIAEEIRTRRGSVIYFGDDYRKLLRQRKAQRSDSPKSAS